MSRRLALFLLLAVTLTWTAAVAAAPVPREPRLAALTYAAGSLICHQRPERSFYRDGAQYPVCARCLGLYGGALAGVLLWTVIAGAGQQPRAHAQRLTHTSVVRRALVVSGLPTLVTVLTSWLGWWDAGNVLRAVLALPLGAVIAVVTAAVMTGDLR